MESKDIYNLLDNGWIYVKFDDPYFDKVLIENLPKKYVKRIEDLIFVKKCKKLHKKLEIMGADLSQYDSTIIIQLIQEPGKIIFNYQSLDNSHNLIEISKKIADKSIF